MPPRFDDSLFSLEPEWPETGTLPDGSEVKLSELAWLVRSGKLDLDDAKETYFLGGGGEYRVWPFKNRWDRQTDDDGKPFVCVTRYPSMTRYEFEALGWTDNELEAERAKLGVLEDPNAPVLQDGTPDSIEMWERRRAVLDALTKRWHED